MAIIIKIYFNEQTIISFSGRNYLSFKFKINTDLVIGNIKIFTGFEEWIKKSYRQTTIKLCNNCWLLSKSSLQIFDKGIAGNQSDNISARDRSIDSTKECSTRYASLWYSIDLVDLPLISNTIITNVSIPINDHLTDDDNSTINRNLTKCTPYTSPLNALNFTIQSCNNPSDNCSRIIGQSQQRHDATTFNTRFHITTKENIDQFKTWYKQLYRVWWKLQILCDIETICN